MLSSYWPSVVTFRTWSAATPLAIRAATSFRSSFASCQLASCVDFIGESLVNLLSRKRLPQKSNSWILVGVFPHPLFRGRIADGLGRVFPEPDSEQRTVFEPAAYLTFQGCFVLPCCCSERRNMDGFDV